MVKYNIVTAIWILNILSPILADTKDESGLSNEDLEPAASHRTSRYAYGIKECNPCNQVPWIPIAGRKLHFTFPEVNFNSRVNTPGHRYFLYPPLDQYGAPQGVYGIPRPGEVVEFMLPPPPFIKKPPDQFKYLNTHTNYARVSGFSKLPNSLVGTPPSKLNFQGLQQIASVQFPTSISQDIQPPRQPGINSLPLGQINLPFARPSDSYGNPLQYTESSSLPLVRPSDSYGNPVNEPITLASGEGNDFHHNQDVQVVPSVRIADYTASIEHPIDLIQSPLLDLIARDEASVAKDNSVTANNPIFVKDTLASASTINSTTITAKRDNDKFLGIQFFQTNDSSAGNLNQLQSSFKYNVVSTVMLPPPPSKPTWITDVSRKSQVHYGVKDKWLLHNKSPWKLDTTTRVYNIKDLLVNQNLKQHLPYDVISLQKNIDDWTHQSYSNKINFADKITEYKKVKKIPEQYFTTQTYSEDHLAAGSSREESISQEVESNLIDSDETFTTTSVPFIRFVPETEKVSEWDNSQVSRSNISQEKVYVVTPQSKVIVTPTPATAFSMAPKIQNGKVNIAPTITKISVRIEPQNQTRLGDETLPNPIKVVYSEWPHLINNLETTTTTVRPTSSHPLLGLMGVSSYTPPPNSTVETILGHSKVSTMVTPPGLRERNTNTPDVA